MLLNLHVKNFVLIEEAEVDFSEGLNILTGETGAGKSIIIGSVLIALGGKVSADMIRKDCESAFVELTFSVRDEQVREQLGEMGIELEDDLLILSRKIMKTRTLNRVNGENVTVSILKKIAGLVLDVHGQHEHQSLLHKRKHLEIVDAYAEDELSEIKKCLSEEYHQLSVIDAQLSDGTMSEEEKKRKIDFLQYEITEIADAKITEREDEILEERYRKMCNSQNLTESVGAFRECLAGEQYSATSMLEQAARSLYSVQSYQDEMIQNMTSELATIEDLLSGLVHEADAYIEGLQYDGEEFHETEERLNLLNRLKSKYGNSLMEIAEYKEKAQAELDGLLNREQMRAQLEVKRAELLERMKQHADAITILRQKSAKELEKSIVEALCDLNFLDVKFQVEFHELGHIASNGQEEAEFMISTNPGEPLRPLDKIASGGELSRIMLALKSVLAAKDSIGTLIFDEIDTGVSGRTAQKVSEKLVLIAKQHQVICITHLPQIAAMAQNHFRIEKQALKDSVTTSITLLSEEESVEELARILGGAELTEAVYENAREMKRMAKQISEKC